MEETLKEASVINYKKLYEGEPLTQDVPFDAFICGAIWLSERVYSEEEVLELAKYITHNYRINAWENVKYGDNSERNVPTDEIVKEWFEQFKKK